MVNAAQDGLLSNNWIVQEAPFFGAWQWTFPVQKSRINQYFLAMNTFWEFSQSTGIWGLHEVYPSIPAFLEDAEQHLAEYGILHFASAGSLPRAASAFWRGNWLTYFGQNGEVCKDWIDDAGQLLRDLYPQLLETQKRHMELYPALRIWGSGVNLKKSNSSLLIGTSLYSNIWFPELPFGLQPDPDPYSKSQVIDNALLALENSSRLNLWLSHMRELVLGLGGEVEFLRPQQKAYRHLIGVHGIILD